jgi:hypothetical protein
MPSLLVATSSLKLKPDAGWSWQGWDGVISLEQALSNVLVGGNGVVLESHLVAAISRGGAGRNYQAVGFSDTPGAIATVVATVDDATMAHSVSAGPSKVALATVAGKFSAMVATSSNKITPGGPIPDLVLIKTGTWKVHSVAQTTVNGT